MTSPVCVAKRHSIHCKSVQPVKKCHLDKRAILYLPFGRKIITIAQPLCSGFKQLKKMASLTDSIVHLPIIKSNIYIAAFYGSIVFGTVLNKSFNKTFTIVIESNHFVQFYGFLVKLFHCLAHGPLPSAKLEFALSTETHFWQVNSDNLILSIPSGSQTILLPEAFNEFVEKFAKLIVPSLGLKLQDKIIFFQASQMTVTDIVRLSDLSFAIKFIKQVKSEFDLFEMDEYDSFVVLSSYRDVIIVHKKLLSLFSSNECDKRIDILLNMV
jgi:hypothetical protein